MSDFNATTTPQTDDMEAMLLRKIAKLLDDARSGDNPLTVAAGAAGTVTPHFWLMGASATKAIPAGAKGWSFVILTGTATVGGVAAIPAVTGDTDPGTLAADLTITTAAASSAYLRWNT